MKQEHWLKVLANERIVICLDLIDKFLNGDTTFLKNKVITKEEQIQLSKIYGDLYNISLKICERMNVEQWTIKRKQSGI